MPLVMLSGYPASGKTARAESLASSLRDLISKSTNPAHKNLTVVVINDESLGLKRTAYAEARTEKEARATHSSAVKRELGRECIVVADAMNYIKGFRYQMYCEARALQTPSCCVHIATTPARSQELNSKIEALAPGTSYPSDLLDNLIFRYEEPSAFARWDSPLFTLPADDPAPPAEAIFYALVGGAPPGDKSNANDAESGLRRVTPNMATVAPMQTDADALQKVDRVCTSTIKIVQEHMTNNGTDAEAVIAVGSEDSKAQIKMPAGGLTVGSLQRLRREFVGLVRANPAMGRKSENILRSEFASFVNRRTWDDD